MNEWPGHWERCVLVNEVMSEPDISPPTPCLPPVCPRPLLTCSWHPTTHIQHDVNLSQHQTAPVTHQNCQKRLNLTFAPLGCKGKTVGMMDECV